MYAIAFDLDQSALKEHYPKRTHTQAYEEIGRELRKHDFVRQQGSVYFGGRTINAVTTVLAVQEIGKELPWLAKVVTDIRMLRIEENNDLRGALPEVAAAPGPPSLLDALDEHAA
jgi:virulence-associated protein VapD